LSESQASFPLFNGDITQLEKRLWESADQLRANSNLSASEYSNPVLGLIFLRYADHKFTVAQQELGRGRPWTLGFSGDLPVDG
jgi:type I restriction-modification system DNA methylase subunit